MFRCDLRDGEAGFRVGEISGITVLGPLRFASGLGQRQHPASAPFERGLHGIRKALAGSLAHHQTIHHGFDGMLFSLFELHLLLAVAEFDDFPVEPRADESFALDLLQHIAEFPDLPLHQRGEQDQLGFLGKREQGIDDGLRGLLEHRFAGGRIVRLADGRVEDAQVIVNLRGRGDGRARIAPRRTLLNGDGRGQPLDEIDVRLLHLVEELPGVSGKALHIAALALGIQGVKSERRFARTAQARHHDEFLARNLQA